MSRPDADGSTVMFITYNYTVIGFRLQIKLLIFLGLLIALLSNNDYFISRPTASIIMSWF